jgi:hypothetical protein
MEMNRTNTNSDAIDPDFSEQASAAPDAGSDDTLESAEGSDEDPDLDSDESDGDDDAETGDEADRS